MIIATLFLAWFIESLIEYVKARWSFVATNSKEIALVIGLIVAWLGGFAIINPSLAVLDGGALLPAWLDITITGIIIGRGANFVHDVLAWFKK